MSIGETLGASASAGIYQRIVLEEVLEGRYVAAWTPLTIRRQGRTLEIEVLGRPLAVGTADNPIYVMATATLQQVIADELDALLPTTLVLDEIHRQATGRIPPLTQPLWVTDGTMGLPFRLVEQSGILSKKIEAQSNQAFLSDAWKTWVLAKGMAAAKIVQGSEQAFNQGMYSESATGVTPGGERAIQALGGSHNRQHIDYSQVIILMRGECEVDGVVHRTAKALGDAALAKLLSDQGPLTVVRQPGEFDKLTFLPASPGVPPARPTLRRGSKGPFVETWQAIVGTKVDGAFGPKTEAASRAWQAQHGLVADGIVGPLTWAAALPTSPRSTTEREPS